MLNQLGKPGVTVWSATITPAANAGDVVWTRASGETARGVSSGETGDANSRLLKILLSTTTKDLTVTTPGPAANFTDQTLRIGDLYLDFRANADSATYSSSADQTVWSFVGDYAAWYQTGVPHQVAVIAPINPANLLPDPIPAAAAIPGHLLGYADAVNQVPLSLLDARYRRQVPAATPEVLSFPDSPTTGSSVILRHSDSVRQFFTGTVTQPQTTLRLMAVNLNIPGGRITSLQGYNPTYSGPDAAALRGKVFVITSGSPTSQPKNLDYQDNVYSISQSFVPGLRGYYEVSGLRYAGLVVTEQPKYAFTLADGAVYPPSRQYQPDHYTFDGSNWELTPGSVSRWAEAGNRDRIPLNKLPASVVQTLHAGPGTGITVANSGQTTPQRFAFTGFAPAFDLDDSDKGLGTITVQARLRFAVRSNPAVGFDADTENPLLATVISGHALASAVKASAAYSSAAANGVKIGEADIRNGGTTLGALALYAAHDANNALGYYLSYTGASGSFSFGIELSDLEAGFIPNDTPPRRLQGRRLATWTSPGGASVYNPTSGDRITGWLRRDGGVIVGSSGLYVAMNHHTPTANAIGYLLVAKVSGSEVARAVLTYGPGSVSNRKAAATDNSDDQYGVLILGRADPNSTGQFLRVRYRALDNGAERFSLLPYPNRFTGANGAADRWTQLPANLTVDLYEAVID